MTQSIALSSDALQVDDLVQIASTDAFNGMRGRVSKMRWGSFYVDLGVRNGIHFVVPFYRNELRKVSES